MRVLIKPGVCLALLSLLAVWGCSKPALYGTTMENQPVVKYLNVPPQEAFRAAKEALLFRGYSIKQEDTANLTLETYWQPTTADSHYVEVFRRKDFGTVGAYFRLYVKVKPRHSGSSVSITNVAKSFISNVKTSEREETEVMDKIADFTRQRDIQVTNIGLQ